MWREKNSKLYEKFEFADFETAVAFIDKIAGIARKLNHHPKITNTYNVVELELSTHSEGNKITEKDREFARLVDDLFSAEPKQKTGKLKLYTDGGSRGNPGPAALGYVITDFSENIIKKHSKYLGITTNNQAEYQALKEGLAAVLENGTEEVDVFMDSQLIVNQLNGLYKVKHADLLPIYKSIKEILPKFVHITFKHIPREQNKEADALVNECLDEQKTK